MKEIFELEWLGGVAEKHYRRARPDVARLPWGSLDVKRYPVELLDYSRIMWTRTAVSEYRAAAAFGDLLRTMLEAKVPLDLIGMASDFVADEVTHVEIASRIAMELGGGAPIEVDTMALIPAREPHITALQRTNEQVLRVSVVNEPIGAAIVTECTRAATTPLLREAEALIARDEARHVRLGTLYFEWVSEMLDDAERARLTGIALDTLRSLAPIWTPPSKRPHPDPPELERLHELGRIDGAALRHAARRAILDDVVRPMETFGIRLPHGAVDELFLAE